MKQPTPVVKDQIEEPKPVSKGKPKEEKKVYEESDELKQWRALPRSQPRPALLQTEGANLVRKQSFSMFRKNEPHTAVTLWPREFPPCAWSGKVQ